MSIEFSYSSFQSLKDVSKLELKTIKWVLYVLSKFRDFVL